MRISDWSSDVCSSDLRVSAEAATLSQRYGPEHPDLQRAQEQLRDLDKEINGEVRRIVANVRIQANAARERTASLARSLGSTEGTLAANNIASVRLAELERKAESARAPYMAFIDRYKQRSEEHASEIQSLKRHPDGGLSLQKNKKTNK